jgi:hypothetical protein
MNEQTQYVEYLIEIKNDHNVPRIARLFNHNKNMRSVNFGNDIGITIVSFENEELSYMDILHRSQLPIKVKDIMAYSDYSQGLSMRHKTGFWKRLFKKQIVLELHMTDANGKSFKYRYPAEQNLSEQFVMLTLNAMNGIDIVMPPKERIILRIFGYQSVGELQDNYVSIYDALNEKK